MTMTASEKASSLTGGTAHRPVCRIERDVCTQAEFDGSETHECVPNTVAARRLIGKAFRKARASSLRQFVPIFAWLPAYKLSDLSSDFVAGVTVAIFKVPQAMAYATLAGLPPSIGLYTAFFSPMLYAFFGTSRHVSLGMFSVVALMIGAATQRFAAPSNSTAIENIEPSAESFSELSTVRASTAITFTVAVFLGAMVILQLHFVVSYMSDQLVSGFTAGAACHVLVSQLPKLFGLKISSSRSGPLKLIYTLRDFFAALHGANMADFVASMLCIAFVHVGKWHINPRVQRLVHVPIPFELIAMIIATLASHFAHLDKRFKMEIISKIPTGFPKPSPPAFHLIPKVAGDAAVIAIVVFAITISLCRLFEKKHGYRVDRRQELRTLFIVEVVISFFSCHPACGSLTRTAINSQCGAKTQVSSIVSATLMAFVILWIAPLLKALPKCILASIIVVALQSMLLLVTETRQLWKTSKIDLSIWVVSCAATLLWDISEGLGIALGFALLTVVLRSQWPRAVQLKSAGNESELYKEVSSDSVAYWPSNVLVFRYDAPLLFVNAEHFKRSVLRMVDRRQTQVICSPIVVDGEKASIMTDGTSVTDVVVDACGITQIDSMGVECLKDVHEELCRRRIRLLLASCKVQILEHCERCGLLKTCPREWFYPSVHDAVLYATEFAEGQKSQNDYVIDINECLRC